MGYYSDTYLANIKKCVGRAISIQAIASAKQSDYLTEKCRNCNNPVPECCDLQSWLAIVNGWDNTDGATNALTEADFKTIISNITTTLQCTQSTTALFITLNPVSTAINQNSSLTLSGMAAGGVLPYTYQWLKNGVAITNATNPTLVFSSIVTADAGQYALRITDAQNISVTTTVAVITVNAGSLTTSAPTGAGKLVGESITFSTTPSGGIAPYSYQWKKNGSAISGATSQTFTINNLLIGDAATYTVTVTDSSMATVTSSNAVLTVTSPSLSITSQPVGVTITEGEGATFSVVATGGVTPYSYQWKKDNVIITGATGSTLQVNAASLSDAGVYSVVVTDANLSSVTSSNAQLAVNTSSNVVVTYGYSYDDPFVDNEFAPTIDHQATINIAHNADISLNYPAAAMNTFIVVKVPAAESIKHGYQLGSFSFGTIGGGDPAFRDPFQVGSSTYYVSKDPAGLAFNYLDPIQLKA